MRRSNLMMIFVLVLAAVPVSAQLGSLKKVVKSKKTTKTSTTKKSNTGSGTNSSSDAGNKDIPNDPNNYYIGADEMAGTSIGGLRVCSDSTDRHVVNWKSKFKAWLTAMSDNAMQKSFHAKKCELLGYTLTPDLRGAKFRKVDDLKERANGFSVYQVEKGELVLVKRFAAESLYVVVAPRAAKDGLTLKDLVLCVSYDLRGNYKRKVKMTSGCNKVESRLDYLGYYKDEKNPDEWKVNSALFTSAEFTAANKKGAFKGYKVYTLVGDVLSPMK